VQKVVEPLAVNEAVGAEETVTTVAAEVLVQPPPVMATVYDPAVDAVNVFAVAPLIVVPLRRHT